MAKRNDSDMCATPGCENRRPWIVNQAKRKDGTVRVNRRRINLCYTCKARKLKQRHPATYTLNGIRASAYSRGIPFSLTLSEFKEFCARTGYMEKKGTKCGDLTIDRIDPDKGYSADNIRAVTLTENCSLGATYGNSKRLANRPQSDDPF